jgi:catechol 2,3-dioxygenase
MITPTRIGHVVLKVRDLERSVRFYTEILGLTEVDRFDEGDDHMVFFAWKDNHHDLAIYKVRSDAETPRPDQVGMFHVAFEVASEKHLREAYGDLKAKGIEVDATEDHGASHSLYFRDPDGNPIELYANTTPAEWGSDVRPSIAQIKPLSLED